MEPKKKIVRKPTKPKKSLLARFRHFGNDGDGFSSRDYLLIVSTGVFYASVIVAEIALLRGQTLDPLYLELIELTKELVMTVVIGVMGVQGVQLFRNKKDKPKKEEEMDI